MQSLQNSVIETRTSKAAQRVPDSGIACGKNKMDTVNTNHKK